MHEPAARRVVGQLVSETALNQLEVTTLDTGQAVMRHLLVDQWRELVAIYAYRLYLVRLSVTP